MLSADQIEQITHAFGDPVWYSNGGDQINVPCPYCPTRGKDIDRSGHLGISTARNKVHCVRCDWGHGNARKWLLESRGITVYSIDLDDLASSIDKIDAEPPKFQYETVELPDGCVRFHAGHLQTPFGQSLLDKNILPRMMKDLFACEYGRHSGYVIFPFYEHGDLVYWQGRGSTPAMLADKKRKKYNPDKTEAPLGKAHWLYGFDDATKGGTAFLCEGTLDQKSLHTVVKRINPTYFSCGLQGTSMSFPDASRHFFNSQFGKLWALSPVHTYVVLDDDAWEASKELAKILNNLGLPSTPVRLVGGDPNEIPAGRLHKLLLRYIEDESGMDRTIQDLKDLEPNF